MHLRAVIVDEFTFLTCIKHKLWSSKKSTLKGWQKGDYLAFLVDERIAGLAQIVGKPFALKEKVMEHGLYPNRRAIKFLHIMLPENRPPLTGEIRD